jgi:hypothetical protein
MLGILGGCGGGGGADWPGWVTLAVAMSATICAMST